MFDSECGISVFDFVTSKLLTIFYNQSVGYTKSSDDVVAYKFPNIILYDPTCWNCFDHLIK